MTNLGVGDVLVFKGTDDVVDTIYSRDVGQEGIAKSLSFMGTRNQTSNINYFQSRGYFALGLVQFAQPLEPLVGQRNTRYKESAPKKQ